MKLTNELKTGVFVLICIAALLGLLIKVGNFTFFKKGYMLKTRFHFTGGVKKSAPVRLSGVDVGEVRSIRLLYDNADTVAEMDLWFEDGAKVREGSIATVATLGLMGEKYVEIRAGKSEGFATPGMLIDSEEPVRIEDLIEIGKKVANDVGKAANSFSALSDNLNGTITENRPKIDGIFDNLEETAENFNDFSQDVKYHPWKVLAKGKEVPRDQMLRDREAKRAEKAKRRGKETVSVAPVEISASSTADGAASSGKQNFGASKRA